MLFLYFWASINEQKKYLDAWETYTQTDKTVVKFVPASGAASRMFKNLFEFLGADYDAPQSGFEKTFFEKIEKFAFYDDLNAACLKTAGKDIPALLAAGDYNTKTVPVLRWRNIWWKVRFMRPIRTAR